MARPRRKREYQKIVVDDKAYQWRFVGVLSVYADCDSSNRGQKLIVDWRWVDWIEPESENAEEIDPQVVTPGFVRLAIQQAVSVGWDPAVLGKPFLLSHRKGEFVRKDTTT